jgi:hypothetical protein
MYLYLKRWTTHEESGWFRKTVDTTYHLRVRLELSQLERKGLALTKVHTKSAVILNSEEAIWNIELLDEPYVDITHVNKFKIDDYVEQLRETALGIKQELEHAIYSEVLYEEIVED